MIAAFRETWQRFRGFGDHALSVPSLDGAFRPNAAIETAPVTALVDAPDNIVRSGDAVLLSRGGDLLELRGGDVTLRDSGSAAVTAMAGRDDGRLAVARSGGAIALRDAAGAQRLVTTLAGKGDITALCHAPDGGLFATIGAAGRRAADWRHDLMQRGATGAVWRLAPDGAATLVADRLAWPCGIACDPQGNPVVSEAWNAAILHLTPGRRPQRVIDNLPGYPGRIIAAGQGGYWLAVFAPRNQLVEFVIREKAYRTRMMAEIAPDYWVCPALAPATSPLAVMQDGAQKIGGAIKPWAPTLSYGLVVRIDAQLLPQSSHHSRANDHRHGITSLAETGDALLVTSQGAGAVLSLPKGA